MYWRAIGDGAIKYKLNYVEQMKAEPAFTFFEVNIYDQNTVLKWGWINDPGNLILILGILLFSMKSSEIGFLMISGEIEVS